MEVVRLGLRTEIMRLRKTLGLTIKDAAKNTGYATWGSYWAAEKRADKWTRATVRNWIEKNGGVYRLTATFSGKKIVLEETNENDNA